MKKNININAYNSTTTHNIYLSRYVYSIIFVFLRLCSSHQLLYTQYAKRRRISVSNGLLCTGTREKIPRTFAHRAPLLNKIVLPLLVCWCIDVGPSNATERAWISPLVTSVKAPIFALHPPLPASRTVWSSWGLLVVCPLNAQGVTGITS